MTTNDFRLPDVGEGLTEAEIINWHVAVGDQVKINQDIVEIETAKSLVDLPSPVAGTVTAIHVATGDTVAVGTILITIADVQAQPDTADREVPDALGIELAGSDAVAAPEVSPVKVRACDGRESEAEEQPLVLVGPGPQEAPARRIRIGSRRNDEPLEHNSASNPARTTPPVRALAKSRGVNLDQLAHGIDGLITRADVEAAAGQETEAVEPPSGRYGASAAASGRPREIRIPIKGVRKVTAEAMARSAFTAPHVTEWLTVDVTATMDAVARLKKDRAWANVRVSPMLFVARAFVLAVRSYPEINATWDDDAQEIIVKTYVNLGIAAATRRGLIVPNIKDADQMDLRELADALDSLVTTARGGKSTHTDMSHGTVTITNIGALGVDAGTPILNPGESAILAFGAVRPMPWVHDDQICVRQVTQLAMSFDHRLVDGELGSNVLARVGKLLHDPGAAFLYA